MAEYRIPAHVAGRAADRLEDLAPSRPYLPDHDIVELAERFASMLRSGVLTKGVWTERFEAAVEAYVGSPAIAMSSATAGLEALCAALQVAGGEVVVPAHTFVATAAAVVNTGVAVRFVNIEQPTLGPTLDAVLAVLSDRTRAVILCHMGGVIAPQTPRIVEYCAGIGVPVVEDAAARCSPTC